MKNKKLIFITKLFQVTLFAFCICVDISEASAAHPKVFLSSGKLFVESNGETRPFILKGVTWSPGSKAPDTGPSPVDSDELVDYGFFFDWPGRNPKGYKVLNFWMRKQFKEYYKQDIALLKELGVNAVRTYIDFGEDESDFLPILDQLHKSNIMVVLTIALSKESIDTKRYLKIVKLYKDHPAILMWSLGNEWNLDYNRYYGYLSVESAAIATNKAAFEIKKIDKFHPVTSSLGDRFYDIEETNTIAWILKNCPNVDLWGLNIYRGRSFGNIFNQWHALTEKPFYFSEFGTDSFRTTKFTKVNGFQAKDCQGKEDEDMQADHYTALLKEIKANLVNNAEDKQCLGGFLHEFNDEYWKVGSYHADLGGLIDYDNPNENIAYKYQDDDGFFIVGGHPDNVANEEHFGIVTADRKPKKAFYTIKEHYKVSKARPYSLAHTTNE